MAVRVGRHARLVWASLEPRDFAAVEHLVDELIELDDQGRVHALEVAATTSTGPYDVSVVFARNMTALVSTRPNVVLFGLGRPD